MIVQFTIQERIPPSRLGTKTTGDDHSDVAGSMISSARTRLTSDCSAVREKGPLGTAVERSVLQQSSHDD
jgi:hypothetical protein